MLISGSVESAYLTQLSELIQSQQSAHKGRRLNIVLFSES